jgi:hypothetical protein
VAVAAGRVASARSRTRTRRVPRRRIAVKVKPAAAVIEALGALTSDDDGFRHTGFTGTTLLANDRRFRERHESTELRGLFERLEDDDGSSTGGR